MLTMPPFIQASGIVGQPVTHDEIVEEDYFRESSKLESLFDSTSNRCILGCAASIAEWIAWRYEGLADQSELLEFIEAIWVGLVDEAYLKPHTSFLNRNFNFPAESAITYAGYLLDQTLEIYRRNSDNLSTDTGYLCFLCRAVLPNKRPFEHWLRATLTRLAQLAPYNEAEPRGAIVSRAAFDPDASTTVDQMQEQARIMLSSFDPSKNRFLRSAEELIQAGFSGTPYGSLG